jgi:hypothetical protein
VSTLYQFVPWVRRGAAALVRDIDTLDAAAPARVTLPVSVRVNQRVDVPVTLRLFGPGDVAGLDTRAVVRTDPLHMATNFEPNYFPAVEFDLPELPWLLTPATGNARGQLRPWLCLVVVRKQDGVTLTSDRQRPLPVLGIRAPAQASRELPDLNDSWAWAHAQVIAPDNSSLRELLSGTDPRPVSRLICPRRLDPNQSYFACVVPAFAAGRRAGLGELPVEGEDERLEPAWIPNPPDTLELPVYFHWEFSTGSQGDFESLARRLRGQIPPEGIGRLPVDLRAAGFGLPDAGVLQLEGALTVPNGEPRDVTPEFRTALTDILNRPEALRHEVGDDPIVAPPIYGSWHTAQKRIDQDTPSWVRELNLDPRHRAAAGLGTLVIQDQQEQLMASAWEQLGEPGREQRKIYQHEFGRAVLKRVHADLAQLSPQRFLSVSGPLQARVRISTAVIRPSEPPEAPLFTASEQVRRSRLPLAVTSAAFRRVTRPRGPLVRRVSPAGASPDIRVNFTAVFATAPTLPLLARSLAPAASVSAAAIEERIRQLIVPSTMLEMASQFSAAVREMSGYLTAAVGGGTPQPPRPVLDLVRFRVEILQQIDPARAPQPLTGPTDERAETVTTGSLPGPSFPQPMYETLRDLAPDVILPGRELIPPDSIILLETNPRFIAAFMVGLNQEMSRELLWREYPSDLRATCFRRFWAGPAEMPELHRWAHGAALGDHVSAEDEQLVVLIRGELLQRYPQTLIYAVPAVDRRTPGAGSRHPIFRATLGTDIMCLGFDLSAGEARGDNGGSGWFFAIEQPHGDPRFGLDASTETGLDPALLQSWNNLSWGDMAATDQELSELTHAPVRGRLLGHRIAKLQWGQNAGHLAGITLQRPFRVLQHASMLLPPRRI